MYPAASNVSKGAYILWESQPGAAPDLLLLASGSEVAMTLEAGRRIAAEGGKGADEFGLHDLRI